jgi:secreted Zn-dependent insulinase-like peptidase
MKFDYLEKKQGMNYCSSIAKNLHKKNLEEILVFPYLMETFRPDLIKEYLNELRFDNLIVMT